MKSKWGCAIIVLLFGLAVTMPDLPDDYPFLPNSVRFPLVDLGEIAARLGSPVVYDRRGEVLFIDHFANGLGPYSTAAAGTGAEVITIADGVDIGPFAANLVGGSDGARTAQLYRWQAPLAAARYGLEISFWMPDVIENVEFFIVSYDGSNALHARLRYTVVGSKWEYFNSSGGYTTVLIPELFSSSEPMYHWIKMVIDTSLGEYVRFLVDDAVYGLINADLRSAASPLNPGFDMRVVVTSVAGSNNRIQIGRFIVTANEP